MFILARARKNDPMNMFHREKIENEKSISIFKKVLCLVFSISLSVPSAFSVVKILAGAAEYFEKQ